MRKMIVVLMLAVMVFSMVNTAFAATYYPSAGYSGSCNNSFYTTSTIYKDTGTSYYKDYNTYARLGSTSGGVTAYTSRLYIYYDEDCTQVKASHSMDTSSGATHTWNTSLSGYGKLRVINNDNTKLYVMGTHAVG